VPDPPLTTTIFTAAVTTVVTTPTSLLIARFVIGPRLEVNRQRRVRILEAREEFSRDLLALASMCERLQVTAPDDNLSPDVLAKLNGERERWRTRIDELTRQFVDNIEHFAGTYVRAGGVRDRPSTFAFLARAVWISDRPEEARVDLVLRMAAINRIFFRSSGTG
jgi:hypothetical protein